MVKKKDILSLYPGINERLLMSIANHIIAKRRKIPFALARWKKNLTNDEYEIFHRIVGAPIREGQSVDEFAPTKKYLFEKYGGKYPKEWIRAEINEILATTRPYIGTKWEKTLLPREYEILKLRLE